jgi:hypothetical protein
VGVCFVWSLTFAVVGDLLDPMSRHRDMGTHLVASLAFAGMRLAVRVAFGGGSASDAQEDALAVERIEECGVEGDDGERVGKGADTRWEPSRKEIVMGSLVE